MSALVTDTQDVLDRDWEEIWKRLRRFAHKYYYWLPARVRGTDLDDLVQEAISDTICGTRHLPPDVELVTFLCQVIRSKASHLLEKESRVVPIEQIPQIHRLLTAGMPQIDYLEEADKQAIYQRMCHKLRESVKDDELVSKIVDKWLEKPDMKPQGIANELGVQIDEMRNAQKRLSRVASKLWEEWRNAQA